MARSAIRYLWAFPNTLVGLVFLPTVLQRGSGVHVVDGVLEIHGPLVAAMLRHLPIRGGAAAMTFGHVVLGRNRRLLELTRSHERIHVRQCERWGPVFIPAYLMAAAWAGLRGQGAYLGNRFEREAYRGEDSLRTICR